VKKSHLRSKDVAKLVSNFEVKKKDICILIDDKILEINGTPSFFYHNKVLVPTLKLLLKEIILPKITIDMGAIKFVIKGADIMRPGITQIDDTVEKGKPIVIVDETHGKPIAVGIALLGAKEMRESKSGKVIQNIHYVGDEIWQS
jgi:PUA-domain protein